MQCLFVLSAGLCGGGRCACDSVGMRILAAELAAVGGAPLAPLAVGYGEPDSFALGLPGNSCRPLVPERGYSSLSNRLVTVGGAALTSTVALSVRP